MAANPRLGYVQHPFPTQGQTTDTTHVLIDDHATREGSYVALTRARDHTHIYAADTVGDRTHLDSVQQLAERMRHTEPDAPSIATPLAHETAISMQRSIADTEPTQHPTRATGAAELDASDQHPQTDNGVLHEAGAQTIQHAPIIDRQLAREAASDAASPSRGLADQPDHALWRERTNIEDQALARRWPRTPHREPDTREQDNALEHDHIGGWEP